jgi:hypothetical protein
MKGWIDIGSDTSWEDYGGKWAKRAPSGVWFVVTFTNMYDACGERGCKRDGVPQYLAEIQSVDPSDLPDRTIREALECVGYEETPPGIHPSEPVLVEACVSYGAYAPLDCFSSDTYPLRLRARARRAAEALIRDSQAFEERLSRPVNAIGSTAREYMQGDLNAALIRYQGGGGERDGKKDLMLKLQGMPEREP